MNVWNFIDDTKLYIGQIVRASTASDRDVIARYTATFAVNFTDWIGKTLPWVRHELARHALVDNLRCESVHDHVGMLEQFAAASSAMPEAADYAHVRTSIQSIRDVFRTPEFAGLKGIMVLAVLETTSEVFIPDLATRAKRLGCQNFQYTEVHGEADAEHSKAFVEAVEAEVTMGYENWPSRIESAADDASALIRWIYD